MEWDERSFLLDIKPTTCFANLFVRWSDRGNRDFIRIVKDGVEVLSNGTVQDEDTLEQIIEAEPYLPQEKQSTLKALVDGFTLFPDSVTNYVWTDDQLTFCCKLKVERWEQFAPRARNVKDALRLLKCDISLDQFCQQLHGFSISVKCHACGKNLLKCSSSVTHVFQLPSTNYSEVAEEWWCCSSRHDNCENGHEHTSVDTVSHSHLKPKTEQCFVGDLYFVLNASVVEGVCVADGPTSVLCCDGCKTQLGVVEKNSGYPQTKENGTLRFYHLATDLQSKNDDSHSNFLSSRFRTRERYFAWLLLSESEAQSSLKFALKTLDNHPTVLLWILDVYSILVNGHLSDAWNATPFTPFPVLKFLYKKMDDRNISDPRVTGQDASVALLTLPDKTCEELYNYLSKSSIGLPPACRQVGQFTVGHVRMASSV